MANHFDKRFFEKNQKAILLLANIFRGKFLIDRPGVVFKATPNALHIRKPFSKTKTAILYSNEQYAELLHVSFRWLWEAMHSWDMAVNRYAPALNLGFDTYTSQPDGTDGRDTFQQSNVTGRNGQTYDAAVLAIGEFSGATAQSTSLIKMDFSSIPSGAESSSATFSLWAYSDAATSADTVNVHRQKRIWVHDEATWLIYSTGNNWQTNGGTGANDMESTAIASVAKDASTLGEIQWTNWITADLDEMFSGGGWTNNGFLFTTASQSNDWFYYRASGYATAAERPKMVIEYTAGTTVLPSVAAITAAGQAPNIEHTTSPSVSSLTAAGQAPNIEHTSTPAVSVLTAAGQAATAKIRSMPAVAALTAAGQSASTIIKAFPSVVSLLITANTPLIIFPVRLFAILRDTNLVSKQRDTSLNAVERDTNLTAE